MPDAYIIGATSTPFGRHPDESFFSLTRQAVTAALTDAGRDDGADLDAAWFGNCAMGSWGQPNIRGQICLEPLGADGLLPADLPVVNVEAGCATGSLALHGAVNAVRAGDARLALAVGTEKLFYPQDPRKMGEMFLGAIDQLDPARWQAYFAETAAGAGLEWAPDPRRIVFLDMHALQARWHMRTHGTTAQQIAAAAAKSHRFGVDNETAQYRVAMAPDDILADRPVVEPFTRSMCAPVSDGAAAVIVASEAALAALPPATRERAVRVRGIGLSSGRYRRLDEPGLTAAAARRAYAAAGLGPGDVDVAEVHDATSFAEISESELLGFCPTGGGGEFIASGAADLGGRLPLNTSGGLVSKGHPVGATGLSMVFELCRQLRGEAGARQVDGAAVGLAQNCGGAMGLDEAACAVTILSRGAPRRP